MGSRPSGPLERAVASIAAKRDAPPGVCLAVSAGGAVAAASSGVCQVFDDAGPLSTRSPIGLDTPADLGSVTEMLATTAGLIPLLAAGELSLEQPLSSVLGATRGEPCAGVTLGQLLEHRGGLEEWWPLYLEAGDGDGALRVAAARPLADAPGAARRHSHLGFILLGAVLAAASQMPLRDAVQELVLGPLGLRATRYASPATAAPVAASSIGDWIEYRRLEGCGHDLPAAYPHWRTQVLAGEVSDGNAFHAFGSIAGHAGLFSTVRDLLRFGDALCASLDGDGPLDRATLRRCLTPGGDQRQGLGFRRWPTGCGPAWGHNGFPGVAVAVLPDVPATVALVTNRLHVEGAPRDMKLMWEPALRAACEHCASGV